MDDPSGGLFAVHANVVRGGNRLLRVVAHVVCRDPNGQVRWEDDAVTEIPIPAGTEVPEFRCESTWVEVVSGGEGEEPAR